MDEYDFRILYREVFKGFRYVRGPNCIVACCNGSFKWVVRDQFHDFLNEYVCRVSV